VSYSATPELLQFLNSENICPYRKGSVRRLYETDNQYEKENFMCPACIATMTFLVAGSASTGGLTALATRKFRRKAGAKTITGNSQKTRAHHDKD
jgi:hypothetical protein